MKIKIYLHGYDMNLHFVKFDSPALHQLLEQAGVEVEQVAWDGEPDSLPTDERVLIRGTMYYGEERLKRIAEKCHQHGHLLFYRNGLVGWDGTLGSDAEALRTRLQDWLR